MMPRPFAIFLAGGLLSCISASAQAEDWAGYIRDFGISALENTDETFGVVTDFANGVDATKVASQAAGSIAESGGPKLTVPSYIGNILDAADFEAETVNREKNYNISWGDALVQQTAVTASSWLTSYSLNAALGTCFTAGACAISTTGGLVTLGTGAVILGSAFDAYQIGRIVDASIDIEINKQKLAESAQAVQVLQQRVDQLNASQQVTDRQKAFMQWPTQTAPGSSGSGSSIFTPSSLPQAAPAKSSIITIRPGLSQANGTAAVSSQAAQSASPRGGALYEIGVGPASIVNTFGGPVAIGEPALIGAIGKPIQIGTPTGIGSPTSLSSEIPESASVGSTSPSNNRLSPLAESLSTTVQGTSFEKSAPAVTQIVPGANGPQNMPVTIIPGAIQAATAQAPQARASTPYIYTQPTFVSVGARSSAPKAAQADAATMTELETLKAQAAALKPPPLPSPPTYNPPPPMSPVATSNPGGISLSLAAAMRMRLDIDFDGMYFKDGQIVLAGSKSKSSQIDAALFLTALRAACEPGDPYFSLDPDDGASWLDQGRRLSEQLDQKIRKDLPVARHFDKALSGGLSINVILARRDYQALWSELVRSYPNFKTKLVFRPEWLRQTRFGEILYRADVLLKELASGTSILDWNRTFGAQAIDRYVSADARRAAKLLLTELGGGSDNVPVQSAERLWFDFTPQSQSVNEQTYRPGRLSGPAAALYATLQSRGFLEAPDLRDAQAVLAFDSDALDFSQIYPKMFVHVTDLKKHQDILSEINPDFEQLARDVNVRISSYAKVYPELRALIQVFRAYLIAVNVLERDRKVCGQIRLVPLLAAEKVSEPLPKYRPSELIFTYATYSFQTGRSQRQQTAIVSSSSGGISLSGKQFYAATIRRGMQTAITRDLNLKARQSNEAAPTASNSAGRTLLTLNVDLGELLSTSKLPDMAMSSSPEEVLLRQPSVEQIINQDREQRAEDLAKEDYDERLRNWQRLRLELLRREEQWNEAEDKWKRANSAALERSPRDLVRIYGPSIGRRNAEIGLHYILLAKQAALGQRNSNILNLSIPWELVFAKARFSAKEIDSVRSSGFFASIQEDPRTGEVTIAYGAPASELNTIWLARLSALDIQHDAAVNLAMLVKAHWSHGPVTLTGYGPGGELAAYAAKQIGISNAVIFKVPLRSFAEQGNPNLISIDWLEQR